MMRHWLARVTVLVAVAACGGESTTEPPPPPVPTQLSMVTQPSATARNAAALPTQPAVRLRDSQGRPVSLAGVVVTASLSSGTATLAGTTATTDASGVATFSGLTITGLVGSYTLHFSAGSLTPVDAQALSLTAGTPTQMALVTQPSTSAQAGVALGQQPVVQLRDVSGNDATQAGVLVTAALVAGSVTVTNASAATDATGKATFSGLTLSGTAGSYTLRFSASNLPSVDAAAATALAGGSPTQLVLTTQPSGTAVNGTALATQPVVQLRDAFGNDSHHSGDTVTASVISGTGTLSNATATTDSLGKATFSGLSITGTAGTISLRFSASSLTSAVASVVLTAGSATKLGLATAPPASAQSGVALSPAPVVQVQDAQGNAVRQAGVTVTAELASGSVSLSGTTATTDTTGKATFSALTAAGVAGGTFTLRFTASALTAVTGNSTLLTAGTANKLTITTQPSSTAQNAVALGQQPVIQLRDSVGNAVSQSGVTVTATLVSGSAALSGATATTNTSGVATFSALTITGTVGSYTLHFGAPSVTSVDAAPTQLSAGAATQLTLTTQPSTSAQSGVALATQPAVQLRDVSGNAVSQAGVTVAATVVSGAATLANATMATNAGGLATFSGLAITALAGSYTLRFSAGSLTAVDAAQPTQVSAGAAAQLTVITQPPDSAQNGIPLTRQPVIEVKDGAGNLVSSASVVAAIAAGGTGSGSLAAATAISDGTGRATYSGLTISGTVGTYVLSFSAGSGTVTSSVTTSLGAGPAASLAILVQPPANARSGVALATAPVVEVKDASSNLVSGVVVTATVVSGSVTLTNATPLSDANGQATFSGLTIAGPVGDYRLRFSVGPLGVNANALTSLGPGDPVTLTLTTPPPTSAQSGIPLATAPVATVRDGAANGVPGVAVTASVVTGSVSLTNAGATSDVNGQATFTGLTLTGAVGSYTLRFTAGALSVDAAAATQLNAGPPASITLTVQPSTSAQSGVALPQQPVARVLDGAGNPVSGASVTASVPGGGVTLSGAIVATSASGLSSFSTLTITGPVGSYTLRFTVAALSVDATLPTQLSAGPAQTVTLLQQPSTSAQSGVALATQPIVQVQDGAGNGVPSQTVTASVVSGTVTITNGTPATNSSGVATFSGLTLTGAAALYTLRFTSGSAAANASQQTQLNAGAPASVTIVTQPPSTAQSGVTFSTIPVVEVRDASSNPVIGLAVTAAVVSGSVTFTNGTATTGSNGRATFSGIAMSGTVNTYQLTFTAGGVTTPAGGTTSLTAGPVSQLTLTTPPSATAQSSVALATQPVVLVRDAAGNGVPSVTVNAATTGHASVTGVTAVTDAGGVATFTSLTLTGAVGGYSLEFYFGQREIVIVASTPTALSAGPATSLTFATQPAAAAQSGIALATQPALRVRDSANNPIAGVVVTASIASGGGPALANATATTNDSGVATFSGLTMTGSVGSFTLRFSGASLAADATQPTALSAGTPASLTFQTTPTATANNGVALATQPVVRVQDGAGNTVSGVVVSAAVTSGSVTVTNGSKTTDAGGLATFSGLALSGSAGSYTLRFSGASLTLDHAITLSAGAASQITITVPPPTSAQNGVAFGTVPVAHVTDGTNPVSGVSVVATAPGATVTNATAVTNGSGDATFTGIALTATAGDYTLVFSVGPVTKSADNPTTLTVGAGTKLTLTTQPSTAAQSGVALAQQPVVQITDAGGNATSTSSVLVTASLVSGSLTLSNATATTNGSGTATFSGLVLTGAVGSYTLRFTASGAGLTGVDAVSPTVLSAGPASQLTVTADPSDATILGSPLRRQPAVQLRDASGNPVLSSGVTVTASTVSGAPTLSGAAVSTDANGTATFTSLGVTSPVGTYRFRFSSPPASAATAGDTTIAAQLLVSGAPITLASSNTDEHKYFAITVPNGATQLSVNITGGHPGDDADLFVRFAHAPDREAQIWDCGNSPGYAGSTETCILPNPQPGDWYVLVFTFFQYSNVTLTATVSP